MSEQVLVRLTEWNRSRSNVLTNKRKVRETIICQSSSFHLMKTFMSALVLEINVGALKELAIPKPFFNGQNR